MAGKLHPMSLGAIFGKLNNARFTSWLLGIIWIILTAALIKITVHIRREYIANMTSLPPPAVQVYTFISSVIILACSFMVSTVIIMMFVVDELSGAVEEVTVNLSDYDEYRRVKKRYDRIFLVLIAVSGAVTIGFLIYLLMW